MATANEPRKPVLSPLQGSGGMVVPQGNPYGGGSYVTSMPAPASSNPLAGAPARPKWDSMLKNDYIQSKYRLGGIARSLLNDDQGYSKFQEEALRDGPSVYAQLLLDQQDMDRQDQIGDINSQYQMGLQNAMDQMASQGGLYSGAGERIGANSIASMLAARQGARRDSNRAKLDIQAQDELNRIDSLRNLSGMEMDRNRFNLDSRQFDITNSLNERDARRQNEMDKWKTQMETWASNKQADAQAGAGGGCFPAGTMVKMADGSEKKIEEIQIGDLTSGGEVYKVMQGSAKNAIWFDYQRVLVTGSHLVHENGGWVPVDESEAAELMDMKFERYYNFANEDHQIEIAGVIFSDMDDVDDSTLSYEAALKAKNEAF